MREHAWLDNMRCADCGCWAMTYEARRECRGDRDEAVEVAEPAEVDWLKITGEFS